MPQMLFDNFFFFCLIFRWLPPWALVSDSRYRYLGSSKFFSRSVVFRLLASLIINLLLLKIEIEKDKKKVNNMNRNNLVGHAQLFHENY